MNSEIKRGQLQEKPLGMYLVEAGLITPEQVNTALNEQKVSRRRLGQILSAWGLVEQQTIEYLIEKVVLPEQRIVDRELPEQEKNQSQKQHSVELSQVKRENPNLFMLLAVSLRELEIHFSPKRTTRFLLILVFALVFAHLCTHLSIYFLPDYPLRDTILGLSNVDGEGNIPSLYSASALLVCSGLLAIIASAKKVAGDRYVRHWRTLCIIFMFLSLDEFISIHEIISRVLEQTLHTSGFLTFAWVIPGAIFVVICLLGLLRFIFHLPAKTRRLFLIAGTIYVAGALGMEMVQAYYESLFGAQNINYALIVAVEEFFEMLGIVILIYALLSYISSFMKGISIQLKIIEDSK